MLFQIYGETALYQLLGFVLVFTGLVLANEFARRTKTGAARRADGVFHRHCHRRTGRRGMGPEQPDLYQHEQLVPLCQAVRRHRRVHRLHDAQV